MNPEPYFENMLSPAVSRYIKLDLISQRYILHIYVNNIEEILWACEWLLEQNVTWLCNVYDIIWGNGPVISRFPIFITKLNQKIFFVWK